MKKILSLLTMALIAISASAQEVCTFNPNNVLGLDSDNGTALAAGTVIGETASIVAKVGADDTYKPQSATFTVNGTDITGGLQGGTNPKDADGGVPATTLVQPVYGAFLVFEAKADGFLYVMHKASSNKAYTVFEEGTAISYTFTAIGDAATDLGAIYSFTLPYEVENEQFVVKNPIEWAEQEFLKITAPDKYAARWSKNEEGADTWDPIKINGLGVIKFPVYKDCKYIVNANGTKITAAGFVFSTADNVAITYGDETIIGDVVLCFNYITKGKVAEVKSNPNGKYRGDIIIPEKVTHDGVEYSVTKIANAAFSYCNDLTSITIPNSVTSIGGGAFQNCSGLKSITIPNSVTSIEFSSFAGCSGLKSITIPNSINSIGGGAFQNCSGLKSITIPNSVTSIGGWAFYGCSSLTSITIPNSVTIMGDRVFHSCSGLTSVTISNNLTTIGETSFAHCINLTSVTIPNSVTSIGDGAFWDCSGLTSITIPNSVTTIGGGAFEDCCSLTSVTIHNYVTTIGGGAFQGCSGLTSVTIGSGVGYIGNNAFANCDKIENVYCMVEDLSSLSTATSAFDGSYIDYASLHVPASAINAYKTTAPWSGFGDFKTLSGEAIETKKCATPTISFENGEIIFSCETEGVEYVSNISAPDAKAYYDGRLKPTYKYTVSVYATKAGFDNSETAIAEFSATGVFGDLNGDGKVNVADHVKLSEIIMSEGE